MGRRYPQRHMVSDQSGGSEGICRWLDRHRVGPGARDLDQIWGKPQEGPQGLVLWVPECFWPRCFSFGKHMKGKWPR